MRREAAKVLIALFAIACAEPTPPAEPIEPDETTGHDDERPTSTTEEVEPSTDQVVAPPPTPPVELLSSIATDLAVSSVYRDQATQVARLVDGSLATSWNSASGDLVGAWIEVRLPESAEVTEIQMTVGFTSEGTTDLFTGNHRVAAVRVSRDGEMLDDFRLDTASRELQPLAVHGAGGVYRIVVTEVLPGSRNDWREICISELRVMGRAEGAQEGVRFPRTAVRELPPARALVTADRAAVRAEFRRKVTWLARVWPDVDDNQFSRGEPDPAPEEIAAFRNGRRQVLRPLLEFVEPVDALAADALRRALAIDPTRAPNEPLEWLWAARRRDLDVIARAMDAVAAWLDQEETADPAACSWVRAHVALRLRRVDYYLRWEMSISEFGEMEVEGDRALEREAARHAREAARASEAVDAIVPLWERNPRAAANRLRELDFSRSSGAQPDLRSIQQALEASPASCGFHAAP